MPRYIIHKDGVYNEYTTVSDGPCWDGGLTLEQLEQIVKEEYGNQGLMSLPDRLKRAHEKGTSSRIEDSLEETVSVYLYHTGLTLEEFCDRFLSTNKGA